MNVLDLNPEQKKAFNKLKKAYKECEKLNILFVNEYGNICAYDKKYVKDFTDQINCKNPDNAIETYGDKAINYIKSVDSWADDVHLIVLSDEGKKIYDEENNS